MRKKLFLFLMFINAFLICQPLLGWAASDVEVKLTTTDGTTAFDIVDANSTSILSVDSSGNVGVGVEEPDGKLMIKGKGTSTDVSFQIEDLDGIKKVTILDNGRIGIGTISPSAILHTQESDAGIFINTLHGLEADGYRIDYAREDQPGPRFITLRYRGSMDSPSRLQNNDQIFYFDGRAYGTGTADYVAQFSIEADGAHDVGSTPGKFVFKVQPSGSKDLNTLNSALVIKNSGNVGIGTTSPTEKLEVAGTVKATALLVESSGVAGDGNNNFEVKSVEHGNQMVIWPYAVNNNYGDSGAKIIFGAGGTTSTVFDFNNYTSFGRTNSNDFIFVTADAERMRIDDSGNVGIGTMSPGDLLDVYGKIALSGKFKLSYGVVAGASPATGLTIESAVSDGKMMMGDAGEVSFLGNQAFFGYADRSDPLNMAKAGGFYKTGGVQNIWSNLAGKNVLSIADNGDVAVHKNDYNTYFSDGVTSNIPARFYVDGNAAVNGNVLIGTMTDDGVNKLQVNGTVKATAFVGDGSGLTGLGSGISGLTPGKIAKASTSTTIVDSAIYENGGNVGIGTVSPGQVLDVQGAIRSSLGIITSTGGQTLTSDANYTYFTGRGFGWASYGGGQILVDFDSSTENMSFNMPASYGMAFQGYGAVQMNRVVFDAGTATFSGNVGIGTTSPTEKLDVAGTVKATAFVGDGSGLTGIEGAVSGLTPGKVAKASTSTTIVDSAIYENGGDVGIGTTGPGAPLHVVRTANGYPVARFTEDGALQYTILQIQNANSTASNVVIGTGGGSVGNLAFRNKGVFGTTGAADVSLITNDTERVSIISTGNVGIGTTTPATKLQVSGITRTKSLYVDGAEMIPGNYASALRVHAPNEAIGWLASFYNDAYSSQDAVFTYYGYDSGKFAQGTEKNTDFAFYTNGYENERMVIKNDGRIGIGTTTPSDNMHIFTNTTQTTPQIYIEQDGSGDASMEFGIVGDSYIMGIDNSDSDKFKISYSGTQGSGVLGTNDRLVIDATGNVGVGTASPNTKLQVDGNGYFGTYLSDYGNLGANTLVAAGSFPAGFALIVNSSTTNEYARIIFGGRSTNSITKALGSVEGLIESAGTGDTIDGAVRFLTTLNGTTTEKVRVTSTGNVGIGTTTPSEKLEVNGNIKATGYQSSDGTAGMTDTKTFIDKDDNSHVVTIKNGLITSWVVTAP